MLRKSLLFLAEHPQRHNRVEFHFFCCDSHQITSNYIQNKEVLGITGKKEKSELDVFLSSIFSQSPILL